CIGPFLVGVELLSGPIPIEMRSQGSAPVSHSVVPVSEATVSYNPPAADSALGAEVRAAREADMHERLKPAYLAFLRSWATLCDSAREAIGAFPQAERDRVLAQLRVAFPAHGWEEEFPQLAAPRTPVAGAPSGDAAETALAAVDELATRLLRRPHP